VAPAPPPKVTFESNLFRILDMNVPRGTTLQHKSEKEVATIVLSEGTRMQMQPSGKASSEEITPVVGSVNVFAAGENGVQNLGQGDFHLFAIENLGEGGRAGTEPQSVKNMSLAAESRSFGAFEAKLVDNNIQISHVHAVPTVAVLVTGKVLSQGPESKDAAIGKERSGLKQLDQPGQWVFIPPGENHFVVKLGANPTHIVEIELR
jgi:hypothetical protein